MKLLTKSARAKVLSLMKFHPQSAGGIMDTEVLSLMQDFTVEKSINILRRLSPHQEIYRQIYVTDAHHRLVGHINLEDLVLQSPKNRIADFSRENELIIQVDEDQEAVARKMRHYNLMIVPVVSQENYFLGIIPSETLVDVLVEEASEDVQKMAALPSMKEAYLKTPFAKIFVERGAILVILLMAESISSSIFRHYEETLPGFMVFFITMLLSAGGNTSHQTSALVIGGMSSGEIKPGNMMRFLKREFLMAIALSIALGFAAFGRAYYQTRLPLASLVVALTLASIVLVSVTLGSGMPLLLRRLNIDPAFSAGPFLATLMDIFGVLIYCYIIKLILF